MLGMYVQYEHSLCGPGSYLLIYFDGKPFTIGWEIADFLEIKNKNLFFFFFSRDFLNLNGGMVDGEGGFGLLFFPQRIFLIIILSDKREKKISILFYYLLSILNN